jgi:F0F1-type ATP synthase assembly protein I
MSERAQAVAVPGISRVLAMALMVALAAAAAPASAQRDEDEDEDEDEEAAEVEATPLKPDFKGAVGLGLIGAELGFVVPALAGARDTWVYIVFPVLGAGGGAVAGYFLLEQGDGEPEIAVAALTAGMALVIPALVVTLAATAYDPEEEAPSTAAVRRARELAHAGPGLVRWSERGVVLAPPGISTGSLVSRAEALRTGATRANSVRVGLVSGVF